MRGEPRGHRVGVCGCFQPQTVREIGVELRGHETRLGEELRGALADEAELLGPVEVEHDDGFGAAENHLHPQLGRRR